VLAPNPSPMTGRGTNTYVLGHGDGVVVIDPGPPDPGHLAGIRAAVSARGRAAHVLVTHHHVDHSEAAVELAQTLDAPLAGIAHPEGPALDRELTDGETLAMTGQTLRVLATPGHTRDHACFVWAEMDAVFAGDLVAGEGFIVIDPPEGNMSDYLASLARVRDLGGTGPAVLLPGHGPEITDPHGYLGSYIAHRLEREAKVLAAIPSDHGIRAEDLLPIAYSDTPEVMYPVAARSLQAHLDKLVADGRAGVRDAEYHRPG
jgi:glyoxylase-like metal-dependent hydrolase (beta-lactamase superfamily II)